jgi:uncharacterized coiled-coil DUF342 family protein
MTEENPHTRNEMCKEEFRRIAEYMKSGAIFRDEVIKHSQQILTLEKISMDLKESIMKVEKKIDDLAESINDLILKISTVNNAIGPNAETLKKLDERLKSLETWRWFVLGGFAVLIFLIEKVIH